MEINGKELVGDCSCSQHSAAFNIHNHRTLTDTLLQRPCKKKSFFLFWWWFVASFFLLIQSKNLCIFFYLLFSLALFLQSRYPCTDLCSVFQAHIIQSETLNHLLSSRNRVFSSYLKYNSSSSKCSFDTF